MSAVSSLNDSAFASFQRASQLENSTINTQSLKAGLPKAQVAQVVILLYGNTQSELFPYSFAVL